MLSQKLSRLATCCQQQYSTDSASRRRVVITGLGVLTSLGVGWKHNWNRLLNAECGISKLTDTAYATLPCRVAGVIPRGQGQGQLDLDSHVTSAERRTISLGSQLALVAAHYALTDANWFPNSDKQRHRTGVAVGMGMSGLEDIVDTGQVLRERGYKRVPPHFIPRILINMAAGHISLKYGLKGPHHCVSTACTTGVHSVGDASRFISHGDADVMVAGGAEASVSPLAIAGFGRMRALCSAYNDDPHASSRPFDRKRDGFVMGEGAGIVVLEELDHALSRGATIYGEILGYGLSGDANHVTAPSEDGDGAYRCMQAVLSAAIVEPHHVAFIIAHATSGCMQAALNDAGVEPHQVGYINAHATSTPLGDAAECRAIRNLFGTNPPPVSSTKGAVGHLLGAAGAVEAIYTTLACHTSQLPPTLNCHDPDEEFKDMNFVGLRAQKWEESAASHGRRIAVTNSFGFGGTNASLCIAS